MPDKANPMTAFNGDGPMGLWDPSRATQDYAGYFGVVGGSNPDEGKQPIDTFAAPQGSMSPDAFWGQESGIYGGGI